MKEQRWIIGIIVALVAMGGIFFSLSSKVDTTIPKTEVAVTPFGQYLKDQGVKFYGASWCPHCINQKKLLGDGTWQPIYVECAIKGSNEETKVCADAKIESFPTWIFKDGIRKPGELTIKEIEELSGYKPVSTSKKTEAQNPKIQNIVSSTTPLVK